jgi:flavodoxin short chain
MAKAIIVYGSETGNTESVAEVIAAALEDANFRITLDELADNDLILLGSSTWGDEEKELQSDMVDFYDDLEGADLSGKQAAAFGCGDSDYTHFCGAVDLLEERLEQIGATLLDEGLRIDGDPDDDDARNWATQIVAKLKKAT